MHNTNKKLEVLVITLGVFFKCLIPLGQCIQVLKTPPVVLKGYDVVAYHLNAAEGNDIATLGNETYSYNLTSSDSYGIDRIYTFYFVNENNLQLFMNDAWKYVPQFGGFSAFDICFDSDHNDDIWNGIHMGPASGPDNEFHGFGIYNNTLYLNINENMYKTFEENAANCIKLAQTQWIEWFGSLNAGIFNHDCFDDGNACMATPQALAPAVNSSQDRFLTSMSTTEIGNDNGNNNKKSDDYYVGKLTKKEFFVLLIGIAMIFALIIGICIIISQYRKYIKMYDETHDMNSNNDTSNTKDTKIGTKSTKKVKVSNESRRSFIPLASSEEANNPDVIIENMKQIGFGDLSSALEDVGNDNDNDNDNVNDNDNENDENKNNNDNNSDDNNNDDIVDPIKDYDDNSDDNEQNENEIENNKMSNNNNNNNNGAINTTATITTNVESFRLPPPS